MELKNRILVVLLAVVFLTSSVALQSAPVKASASSPTIINSDGSVSPSTVPLFQSGDFYIFTGNIKGEIDVKCSNIIIDGNGYLLQGSGLDMGFWLNGVNNVTIRNLTIKDFTDAIYSTSSSYDYIYGNNLTSNEACGIEFYEGSNYNFVYGNNITSNFCGITLCNSAPFNPPHSYLPGSDYNEIYSNNIQSNGYYGVFISNSSFNEIYKNNITGNGNCGVVLSSSYNNKFYLNNLMSNQVNARIGGHIIYWTADGIGGPGEDVWDNGFMGNFWGDYQTAYPTAVESGVSGVWNMPYMINVDNVDHYPLMQPANILSRNPTPTTVQATAINGSTVSLTIIDGNITSSQMSNVTLATNQANNITVLWFSLTGQEGTTGFCNLTVPKFAVLLGSLPTVFVDGAAATSQGFTEDADNYYVWYATNFSTTHQVSIDFASQSIPELPSASIALITLAIAATATILYIKKARVRVFR